MKSELLSPVERRRTIAGDSFLSLPVRFGCAALLLAASVLSARGQAYKVTNMISDGSVPATVMDTNFINPWAVSASPTWWISAAGSGYNYVVSSAGVINFKVIVPSGAGQQTANGFPSGSATTAGALGMILPNGTKASFLFSTLDGTISGWNSKLGTANALSQVAINNSATGASYTGLAILNNTADSYILAPNFASGSVEIYNSLFKPATLAGKFVDPTLPSNYAPFSVHVLGTQVFVAYAVRTATAPYDSVEGVGNGIVSVFDTSGNFVSRVATGGSLNAPWGVAFAPANFGVFSKALLVGNFEDGMILAFDPKTYAYLGALMDSTGKPLVYESLWELLTGGTTVTGTTSVSGGDVNTVYFTAGLADEKHGLFAGITNTTTAGAAPAMGMSVFGGNVTLKAGASSEAMPLSIAPVNGFSGTVTLACSGLPAGSQCVFSPAQLQVSSTATSTGTVVIATSRASAAVQPFNVRGRFRGILSALLLPFFGLLSLRKSGRRGAEHLLMLLMLGATASLAILGCGNDGPKVTPTPAGTSTVTMTATSGSVSQSTTVTLTVQ